MPSFFNGVVLGFASSLIFFLFLRLTLPYYSKLFGEDKNPYRYFVEDADWLNFLVNRVVKAFGKEENINKINEHINKVISPMELKILSLGNSPIIPKVMTMKSGNSSSIKVLIPFQWKSGPSFNLKVNNNLCIEFDVVDIDLKLLVYYPPVNDVEVSISFRDDVKFECNIVLLLFNIFRLPIHRIPILGRVILSIIPYFLLSRTFNFKTDIDPSLFDNL